MERRRGTGTSPYGNLCTGCGSRVGPDRAWLSWLWGKRCQSCRARYCRGCVNRHLRQPHDIVAPSLAQAHEAGHRMFSALDLGDPSVTRDLGRDDPTGYFESMRLRPGVFRVGPVAFANATEAVAELFVTYVRERGSLDSSTAAWLRRNLDTNGPEHWREVAAALRQGAPSAEQDLGVYRCGYCGHRWLELGGTTSGGA